jgi:hypothetical protein
MFVRNDLTGGLIGGSFVTTVTSSTSSPRAWIAPRSIAPRIKAASFSFQTLILTETNTAPSSTNALGGRLVVTQ